MEPDQGRKRPEKSFNERDPYNPQNVVEGIVYRHNSEYGNLRITRVNGRECEQYINTTPKFYYPGGVGSPRRYQEGKFPDYKTIKVYDKLDGTNIFLFRYKDADGNEFASFKTRLTPFLKQSGFKDWIFMWGKMMEKYKEKIDALVNGSNLGFGFELYGAINQILVKYDVPLDTRLLYALTPDGGIIEPSAFDFPVPRIIREIGAGDDPDLHYKELVDLHERWFVDGKQVEGCVMYVIVSDDGESIPWKCKPPSVLNAQAESNAGTKLVGYNDAYVTAMNAMESIDTIDELHDETYRLLGEVYDELYIDASRRIIDKAIKNARNDVLFKNEVVDRFKKTGMTWSMNERGNIMREMMKYFDRNRSSSVFNALRDYHSMAGSTTGR